jgi:hypothetical protein
MGDDLQLRRAHHHVIAGFAHTPFSSQARVMEALKGSFDI